MHSPRIFLTGASGYVGGEVLHLLKHTPKLAAAKVTCLNRDASKSSIIQQAYPDVKIIQGDLDNTELVRREAQSADVVLHLASTKHVSSAKAIVEGLTASSRQHRPAWIQISGATLYASKEMAAGTFGEPSNEIWSDSSDSSRILDTIKSIPTREVEQTAITVDSSKLRTALVVAPLIYGKGSGPCHQRSIQVPELARVTLELGHGIRLLRGLNAWSNIHVADLARLIILLVEAAMADQEVGWNTDGVYNPENGSMVFGELDKLVAEEAVRQGSSKDSALREIDGDEANKLSPAMSIFWGTNAITKSERAQRSLGWSPREHGLKEEIPELVERERTTLA